MNGTVIYSDANDAQNPSYIVQLSAPILPTIEIGDFHLVNQEDATELPGAPITWITSDSSLTGQLTVEEEALIGFNDVFIEYAHDIANDATDDQEIVAVGLTDSDGVFYYNPLSLDTGDVAVKARVVFYDRIVRDYVRSEWQAVHLQIESVGQIFATVGGLELTANSSGADEIPTTVDPTVKGQLENENKSVSYVSVVFRDAKTDNLLGTAITDASGAFEHTLKNLTEGEIELSVASLEWDYSISDYVEGEAAILDFVLEATTPREVISLELKSDSGVSDTDDVTANTLLVGQIEGDGSLENVTVAIARDNAIEAVIRTGQGGRFFYQPHELDNGQYTYTAKISQWNSQAGQFEYSTGLPLTFTVATQSESAGVITQVGLSNIDSATADIVNDPTISGTVVDNGILSEIQVEYDFDLDDNNGVDGFTNVSATGEFSFRPAQLDEGVNEIRVRTRELHDDTGTTIYGDWVAIDAFNFQADPHSNPIITNYAITVGPVTEVSGIVTGESDAEGARVGFSFSQDGPIIGSTVISEDGTFAYELNDLEFNSSYTVWARALATTSSYTNRLSDAVSETFVYSPGLHIGAIFLTNDSAIGGTLASVDDGVTEQAGLTGVVLGDALSASTEIEVDVNGDGEIDFVASVSDNGIFEITDAQLSLEYGYQSIAVRATDSTNTSEWQYVNFIYAEDDGNEETVAIAQSLQSINEDWQNSQLQLVGETVDAAIDSLHQSMAENSDSNLSFSLAVAEQTRILADKATNSNYHQQTQQAQNTYQNAIDQAGIDFANALSQLPEEQQVTFGLTDFSWSNIEENALQIPGANEQRKPPTLLSYNGESYNVGQNESFSSNAQDAVKLYNSSINEAEVEHQAGLDEAEAKYDSDVRIANQQYQFDIDAAFNDYLVARNSDLPESVEQQIEALRVELEEAQLAMVRRLQVRHRFSDIISGAWTARNREIDRLWSIEEPQLIINTPSTLPEAISDALNNYGVNKRYASNLREFAH